jgi:heme exporter protein D
VDQLHFSFLSWLGFEAQGSTAIWAAVALSVYGMTLLAVLIVFLRRARRSLYRQPFHANSGAVTEIDTSRNSNIQALDR